MDDVVTEDTRGGRVISASCFRVLSLQLETQNEVDVLKPILEELEVLRLSCVLGALTTVNPKDFEFELLEAKDFDDEFARFLRSDVFGAGGEASGGGDQANRPTVRVVGLFGKQPQVKTQLQRLGGWDAAMETKLRAGDLGMYAVVLPQKEDAEDTVKTVVVFAWLLEEHFHADRLRETPAYLLRLLTCLTTDVTCCLSTEDKRLLETFALNEDAMGDDEHNSYSVAFRVEQQQDAVDDVRSTVLRTGVLPPELENATDVEMVKGSFPAVKAIVQAPASTSSKRSRILHNNNADFCKWLAKNSKEYDLRVHASGNWSDELKEAVLKKFEQWPRSQLAAVEATFRQNITRVEVDCTLSESALVENNLMILRGAGDEIFVVDASFESIRLTPSIELIKSIVRQCQNDAGFVLPPDSAKVLKLPVRLPKLLPYCRDLYKRDREDELRALLKKAPYTGLKIIAREHQPQAFLETFRSWLPSRGRTKLDFRVWMRGQLETLKERWWAEVTHILKMRSDRNLAREVDEEKKRLVELKELERRVIVNEAFTRLVSLWSASETHGVCVRISSLQYTKPGDRSFSCSCSRDKVVKAGIQLKLWAFSEVGAMGVRLHELGELDLMKGETVQGTFTVKTRSILVVSTIGGKTRVRRVEFAVHPSREELPSIVELRGLSRSVELCDFNNEERVLLVSDTSGTVGIYRFNDTFSTMEIFRSLNVATKLSLEMPLASVMLLNGTLHAVNHTGVIQSLNTRNQQTSRKKAVAPASADKSVRLVAVMDGGVLGWFDGTQSASRGRVSMKFVASDDLRELPQSVAAEIPANQGDTFAYEVVGELLFLVNTKRGKVYQVKLEASLKSESFRIRSTRRDCRQQLAAVVSEDDLSEPPMASQHFLWTFYHLYEKFPVIGEFFRASVRNLLTPSITLICDTPSEGGDRALFCDGARKVLALVMDKLRILNKPLFGLDLGGRLKMYSGVEEEEIQKMYQSVPPQLVTSLLRELVTFVPIQICRAEGNTLTLMVDGKPRTSGGVDEGQEVVGPRNSSDIALTLRYSLLSPLLMSWSKQCIVITSMGKQSTGKSYFLNHLTGSSFAISGARCTDGAWMSVRVLPSGVLLVVIDFEGLGSFERTEQEDVFLSVLNASVSMFTIFRIEMRLDKEFDELFTKFQKGARLIKRDPRLFRGKLYISVKDVNPNDQRGVIGEFQTKFQRLLERNGGQNFLSDMYAGNLEVNSSPPLGTPGYYSSLSHVQRLVNGDLKNPTVGFASGKDFLDCIRLLLAKLSILDWTSLDESARQLKMTEATKKLPGVLRFGSLGDASANTAAQPAPAQSARDKLVSSSTGEEIHASLDDVCAAHSSMAEKWRQLALTVPADQIEDDQIDLGLCGTPSVGVNKVEAASKTISELYDVFREFVARAPSREVSGKALQQEFDAFLAFIVRRRCLRVQKWSRTVFGDRVPEAWSVAENEATASLQMLLVRCLDSCSTCQLGCIKASVHAASGDLAHDCRTNHACDGLCGFCQDVEAGGKTPRCSKPAGHEGRCECRHGDHTCGKPCVLGRAINCGRVCSKKAGHNDSVDHRCSVGLHKCGEPCPAQGCSRQCVIDVEVPHTTHKCEVDRCVARCVMSGCNRSCSSNDHFHGQEEAMESLGPVAMDLTDEDSVNIDTTSVPPTIHICEVAHVCAEMCEQRGICHIDVMLKQSSKTFVGARSSFQYTYQEMNGSRKKCAFKLLPGQVMHAGKHSCCDVSYDSQEEEESQSSGTDGSVRVRHYCAVRCPSCSYYCQKAHGHSGPHKTTHGNMRNTMFLSDEENIDLIDRKYAAGERGTAEMCNLYCSKMGRGHVHFLACDREDQAKPCVYSGTREDKRRHCTRHLEPTPEHEQDEVLHDRYWDSLGWEDPCTSVEERDLFDKCPYKCDAPEHDDTETSFCVLPAWHAAAEKPDGAYDGFSYVGGHKFECSHVTEENKMHHVFVLDASGSMDGWPWERLTSAFREYVHNRISNGATEDLVSVITFDGAASIEWEAQPITAMAAAGPQFRGRGTSFVAGLRAANEVLSRVAFDSYKPVLVFFSDGYPSDPLPSERLASAIAQFYAKYGLEAFAVGFGHINISVLERVAENLGGSYQHALTGEELTTTFQSISASLGTRAGLALTRPLHEMICVVCQEELAREATRVLTRCQHELHQRCLTQLVDSSAADAPKHCPSCRAEIQV